MRHEQNDSKQSSKGPAGATFYRLAELSAKQLGAEFERGSKPNPDDLAGWEFRGLNHLKATRFLGIRKFVKGFYRRSGSLYGYNLVIEQSPIASEWHALPSDSSPKRHGFYRVRDVDATERDNACLHALLLDYGQGDNPRFDVTRGLRDYLVQVDDDTYLGKAYYALGPARILFPSLFILDRFRRGPDAAP